MLFRKFIVSVIFTFALALPLAPTALAANNANTLPNFSNIVATEGKAVVNISTQSTVKETVDPFGGLNGQGDPFFDFFRRFAPPMPQERKATSLGSGFIISPDGYVLTNAHVIARADSISVRLTDKREFNAKVIGSDARSDIALLKIDATNLPVVHLGDSSTLNVGDWVLAIGSPFGFENSATAGIVSGKERMLPDESYVPFIQTDAAVNPGNSGGPLFNLKGEVIGVNSQIFSRSGGYMGISFAIPTNVAINIVQQLKTKGHVVRSRIGIGIQDLNMNLAQSFGLKSANGVLVSSISAEDPAAKAGIKPGDIILKLEGKTIDNPAILQRGISEAQPGKPLTLTLWRNRSEITVTVIPSELTEESPRFSQREYRQPNQPNTPVEKNLARAGLQVQMLSPEQLKRQKLPFGILVRSATGIAAQAGLMPGDIITGIGSEPLRSLETLSRAIAATKKGDSLAIQIVRQGMTLFVPLTF